MRRFVLASTSLVLASCGLVLDTSPPDDGGPIIVTPECDGDDDCNDGLFCNGVEACALGVCQTIGVPQCGDGIACTVDTCDEATDTCRNTADSTLCEDGDRCDPTSGCREAVFCMLDEECDDDNACTVGEHCGEDMFCVFGTLTGCPSAGCLRGVCNPETGACGQSPDDGACEDGVLCTSGRCEDGGFCVQEKVDAMCEDGASCTDDVCLGVRVANDSTGCLHRPDDTVCQVGEAELCYERVCAPFAAGPSGSTGCATRVPEGACDRDERCSSNSGQCEKLPDPTMGTVACDDGDPCNGTETLSEDMQTCETTGGCPESDNACLESVCVIGTVRGCGFRIDPDRIDTCIQAGSSASP